VNDSRLSRTEVHRLVTTLLDPQRYPDGELCLLYHRSTSARTPVAPRLPRGETYFAIENSKGELGVYLISDGSECPWRTKLLGPSFVNLQILPEPLRGYTMSDGITILGSLDFVMGEVDCPQGWGEQIVADELGWPIIEQAEDNKGVSLRQ
jgi:hypothetical protein